MEKLYSPKQIASKLGMNRETILRWLRSGELVGIKAGKRQWRVSESELKLFLTRRI